MAPLTPADFAAEPTPADKPKRSLSAAELRRNQLASVKHGLNVKAKAGRQRRDLLVSRHVSELRKSLPLAHLD